MFALALRLGRSVAELLRSLSSEELSEWMAYHRMNPIDDMRGDLQTGILASVMANAHRSPQTAAFTPADFMPYLEKSSQQQTHKTASASASPSNSEAAFIATVRRHVTVITVPRHGRTA